MTSRAAAIVRPPVWRRLFLPLGVLALLGLLAVGLLRPSAQGGPGTPLAGKAAPAFTLANLDGGQVSLAGLRGRPVLINFFASWCLPCRDEAPMLRQSALEGASSGLVVLGIVYQDTPEKARAFRDEFSFGFPVLLDDPARPTAVAYGLTGVPETFFIDRSGIVRARQAGPLSASDLKDKLKGIL